MRGGDDQPAGMGHDGFQEGLPFRGVLAQRDEPWNPYFRNPG